MIARSLAESNPPFAVVGAGYDTDVFPHHVDAIPPGIVDVGAYQLRFAWTRNDLMLVQALRFSVFNQELDEGFAASHITGRDEDGRDPWFHHLMIIHRESGDVVGTYRVQTAVMAATRYGFYSATLFELGAIPGRILEGSVEIGRACVAMPHRSGRVLRLLWKGLARYLQWNCKRYLFGCCSLPGTSTEHAIAAWRTLHARNALHAELLVRPRAHARALPDDGRQRPHLTAMEPSTPLPSLFDGYLSMGARVCGAPAFDREFGTTDLLVLLDVQSMEPRAYRSLFGDERTRAS